MNIPEIGSVIEVNGVGSVYEKASGTGGLGVSDLLRFGYSAIESAMTREEVGFPSEVRHTGFRSNVYYGFFKGLHMLKRASIIGGATGALCATTALVSSLSVFILDKVSPGTISAPISDFCINLLYGSLKVGFAIAPHH